MTSEELQILLNLRSTLSEYEHFMSQLSAMVEKGVDIPLVGVMPFPMRDKLYKQVRDLVLGKSAMATEPKFKKGDRVRDKRSNVEFEVYSTGLVALRDPDHPVSLEHPLGHIPEDELELV